MSLEHEVRIHELEKKVDILYKLLPPHIRCVFNAYMEEIAYQEKNRIEKK